MYCQFNSSSASYTYDLTLVCKHGQLIQDQSFYSFAFHSTSDSNATVSLTLQHTQITVLKVNLLLLMYR